MKKTILSLLLMLGGTIAIAGIAAPQGSKKTLLPLSSLNGMPLVQAKVNGKSAYLLLDTAAPFSMISVQVDGYERAWNQLHPHVPPTSCAGPDAEPIGGEVDLTLTDVESAEHYWPHQQVLVTDLSGISRRVGTRVDGVLGQDFLSQFSSVRINYRVSTLELEQ
jgi:Aspartyl protease